MFTCRLLLTDEGPRIVTADGERRLTGGQDRGAVEPVRTPLPPRDVGQVSGQFVLRFEAIYRGRPAGAGPGYEESAWTMTPSGGRVGTRSLLPVSLGPFSYELDWDVARFGLTCEIEKYGDRYWHGSLPVGEFDHATVGVGRQQPPGRVERTYGIPIAALPTSALLQSRSDTVPAPPELLRALPEDALSIAEHSGATIRSIDDAQRAVWALLGPRWRRGRFAISGIWFEDAESYVLSCDPLEWLRDQDRNFLERRTYQVVDKSTGEITTESAAADSPLADRLSRATRHDDGPWAELW